jgi:hypothetical protein
MSNGDLVAEQAQDGEQTTSVNDPRKSYNPFKGPPAVGDFFAPYFIVKFLAPVKAEGQLIDPDTGENTTTSVTDQDQVVVDSSSDDQLKVTDLTSIFRSFITGIEVTSKGDGANEITITFDPPIEEALQMLAQRVIQMNSFCVVEWGYRGGGETIRSDRHLFHMNTQPKLEVQGTSVSLTLVGYDFFASSGMQRETLKAWPRTPEALQRLNTAAFNATEVGQTLSKISRLTPFGAQTTETEPPPPFDPGEIYDTDAKILTAIAKQNGLDTDYRYTITKTQAQLMRLDADLASGATTLEGVTDFFPAETQAAPSTIGSTLIHRTRPRGDEPDMVEQFESDWLFFTSLCEQNNCSFTVIGDMIYVADRNVATVNTVTYRLVFFSQLEMDRDIPILNLTTSAMPASFLPIPGPAREVSTVKADYDAGEETVWKKDPSSMTDQMHASDRTGAGKRNVEDNTLEMDDGKKVHASKAFRSDQTGAQVAIPGNKSNAEEMGAQLARQAEVRANENMDVTIPGVPHIAPLQNVEVTGISVFSGTYLVMEVKHRLGLQGYECDLKLQRNALAPTPAKPTPPTDDLPPGEVSASPVDDEAAAAVGAGAATAGASAATVPIPPGEKDYATSDTGLSSSEPTSREDQGIKPAAYRIPQARTSEQDALTPELEEVEPVSEADPSEWSDPTESGDPGDWR